MTEPLRAIDSSMEMRKKRHISKSIASLYKLKEQMNKNIDLISLINETESWDEMHHVSHCLKNCEETMDAIQKRIKDIELALR